MTSKKIIFSMLGASMMLASCGLFSNDKIPLEGKRVEALDGETYLKPDYVGTFKVVLPKPVENIGWYQSGGSSEHLMPHLRSGETFEKKWDFSFGKGSSKGEYLLASPVVAGRVVFTIDSEAKVTAIRIDDGKEVWDRKLKPSDKSQRDVSMKGAGIAVSLMQKRVFATTGYGSVYALDIFTGKRIWKFDAEAPIRISPTIGGGLIFFQTIDNTLIALDAMTGQEAWRFKTIGEATVLVGGASSAYNYGKDVLIAAFSTGEIRAFKASTGSPLWSDFLISRNRMNSNSSINSINSNPIIDGDVVYAVGNNNVLVALDLRTGTRIWEKEIGSMNPMSVVGNSLFVLTSNLEMAALNKRNGDIVWSTKISAGKDLEKKVGAFAAGPILIGQKLLVATSNGYVFAINPYNGQITASTDLGEGVEISPIAAYGYVLFTTDDAELIAYR
ncbi:MAG: PQQ-binding-like beta-propeller repeat protein [Alphaproteobacteria bacterium]|nr:PQQ-binding-like beta-propeller repeat protein [Alphaproteobacteria bacterium]